jgi:hypothetical protein
VVPGLAFSGRCDCRDECRSNLKRLFRLSDCNDHLLGSPEPDSLRHSSWVTERSRGGPVVLRKLASSRKLAMSVCSRAILLVSYSVAPGGRRKTSNAEVDLERGRRARLRLSCLGRPSSLAGCGWMDSSPLDKEWRRGRGRLVGIICQDIGRDVGIERAGLIAGLFVIDSSCSSLSSV